jgi:hypothetical protein
MTEPIRWASSGSDVDPVLRSVMRYARDQTPSTQSVSAVLEGVQTELSGARSNAYGQRARRIGRHLQVLWRSAAVLALLGGVALAGVRVLGRAEAPSAPAIAQPSASSARGSEGRASAPEKSAAPSESSARAPGVAGVSPVSSRPQVKSSPSAVHEDEIAVLHRARALLETDPGTALSLARQHAARHPDSTFREEREALVVEALLRLGSLGQARARFEAFEQAYPRSPYRRRLLARGLAEPNETSNAERAGNGATEPHGR